MKITPNHPKKPMNNRKTDTRKNQKQKPKLTKHHLKKTKRKKNTNQKPNEKKTKPPKKPNPPQEAHPAVEMLQAVCRLATPLQQLLIERSGFLLGLEAPKPLDPEKSKVYDEAWLILVCFWGWFLWFLVGVGSFGEDLVAFGLFFWVVF